MAEPAALELHAAAQSAVPVGALHPPPRPCPPSPARPRLTARQSTSQRGLKPVTNEPWKIDEDFYNARFETRDVGTPDRYLDKTARKRTSQYWLTDYRARFDAKYGAASHTPARPRPSRSWLPPHPRARTYRTFPCSALGSRVGWDARQIRWQSVHVAVGVAARKWGLGGGRWRAPCVSRGCVGCREDGRDERDVYERRLSQRHTLVNTSDI